MRNDYTGSFAWLFIVFILMLTGCASSAYVYRDIDHTNYTYKPVATTDANHSAVLITDFNLTPDRKQGEFKILVTAEAEEFENTVNVHERRWQDPPELVDEDNGWVFLLGVPLINCLPGGVQEVNCFSSKYGEWETVKENSRTVRATGQRVAREFPLEREYKGTLTITGYDETAKAIGNVNFKHTFKNHNLVSFEALPSQLARRPLTMTIDGQFKTPKGAEKISLAVPKELVSRIDFGPYAWATPEQKRAIALEVKGRYYGNPSAAAAHEYIEALEKIGSTQEIGKVRKFQTTIRPELDKWERINAPTPNSDQRTQVNYLMRRSKLYKDALDAVTRLDLKGYDDYLIGHARESRSRAEAIKSAMNAPPPTNEPSADDKLYDGFQKGFDLMNQMQKYRLDEPLIK